MKGTLPMKSSKVVGWVALVNMSMLLACGGASSIGSSAEAGTSAGGSKGGAADMGGGNTAGKSFGGVPGTGEMPVAGASSGIECRSDIDCPGSGEDCQMCPDGTAACTRTYCEVSKGQCYTSGSSTCGAQCASDADCPPLSCTGCRDGSQACATRQCLMGICRETAPAGCDAGMGMGTCQSSADCGSPPPICKHCVDGSCAAFDCVGNQCDWNCPLSRLQCNFTEDCPLFKLSQCTTLCPNEQCAVVACIQNACELVCPIK